MKTFLYPCTRGVGGIFRGKRISCIIKPSGRVSFFVDSGVRLGRICDVFFIRGILFLLFGLYYHVLGLTGYGDIYEKEINGGIKRAGNSLNVSLKSIVYFIIIISGVGLSYLLLGIIPIKLSFLILPKNYDLFLKRFIIAVIKCLIIYGVLCLLKLFNAFRQYYRFNKAIYDVQTPKCEVNFLTYFAGVIFLNTFILSILGMASNVWYSIFVNILISLFIMAVGYELYLGLMKVKWLKFVLVPFSFLVCEKVSQNETKCVNMILLEMKEGKTKEMKTLESENMLFLEAYVTAKERLEKVGKFEKSDLDFIFAEVLGKSRAEVKLVKEISKTDYKKVLMAVERRAGGEPISKIFNHTNFYGIDFKVTKDVLSPRLDTEVLVEQVLKQVSKGDRVLDIGTGSGAISVTIAKLSQAKVTAIDISEKALEVAKENAKINNAKVNFKLSDLFTGLGKDKFDIIVSNPPYIPSGDIDGLDEEVKKYDPLLALDGGESGLDFYEKIIENAPAHLAKGGKIFFEVGKSQAKQVKKLLQKNFEYINIVKDFNKIERVVYASLK